MRLDNTRAFSDSMSRNDPEVDSSITIAQPLVKENAQFGELFSGTPAQDSLVASRRLTCIVEHPHLEFRVYAMIHRLVAAALFGLVLFAIYLGAGEEVESVAEIFTNKNGEYCFQIKNGKGEITAVSPPNKSWKEKGDVLEAIRNLQNGFQTRRRCVAEIESHEIESNTRIGPHDANDDRARK